MLTQEQSYSLAQIRERVRDALRATRDGKAVDEMRKALLVIVDECCTGQAKIRRRNADLRATAAKEARLVDESRRIAAEAAAKEQAEREAAAEEMARAKQQAADEFLRLEAERKTGQTQTEGAAA